MKKLTKGLLACAFTGAMILTGCGGVANIENQKKDEVLYQGGQVVSVGDYLFYSNGFASGVDSFGERSETEYNAARQYSYLSRINKKDFDGNLYKNENATDKISDKIVGYVNSYMFVYGDYIYYATPNMHTTGENKHVWKYVSIFRCKLDGSDSKEIYTTKTYDSSTAEIKAVKYDGQAYLLIFDGTNLVKINVGNSLAKTITEVPGVTGVAMPKEGEEFNGNIYYTTSRGDGQNGNVLKKFNLKSGESVVVAKENNKEITLVGRVKDMVFYTVKDYENPNKKTETFAIDVVKSESFLTALTEKIFYSANIDNIQAIAKDNNLYSGYVFTTTPSSKEEVRYYNSYKAKNNPLYNAELLVTGDEGYSDTVVIDGLNFYYSDANGIKKKNIIDFEAEEIVSGYTINAGYFGYDYSYIDDQISRVSTIYFFAKEVKENDETGDNYYLYGVDLQSQNKISLYGKNL